jgi:hypothetical protein
VVAKFGTSTVGREELLAAMAQAEPAPAPTPLPKRERATALEGA